MDRSVLVWVGTIVAVLIFLDLLANELRKIFRELNRIFKRLEAYGELPVFSMIAVAGRDAERIAAAIDAVIPLVERGQRAIALLRRCVPYSPKGSSPG